MTKIEIINPQLKDNIDWRTLLTTIAEDLHALSHFKRKTFDALLQYATDFGTISKESLISIKRETKWGANFTHPSSYYPVPRTGMTFKYVRFMPPLPANTLTENEEALIYYSVPV